MLRFAVPLTLVTLAALAGSASADNPVLHANVGPGFTISLQDASLAHVTRLAPGTYTIHVVDQSDEHNFDLTGPGVDRATGTADVVTADWDVTLVAGTYHYVCDAHPTRMLGSFTVGTITPVTPPTQQLSGSVGPGAKISLARRASAGKATITIRDRSSRDNFHLLGPGVNKKTGVAFKGRVTWKVTLKAGSYTFRSDAHRALKGTLRVS
jgi:plastocyanin